VISGDDRLSGEALQSRIDGSPTDGLLTGSDEELLIVLSPVMADHVGEGVQGFPLCPSP